MSLQTDLAAAVAMAQADATKLRAIVQGPAAGPESLVATANGDVKTLNRITAEAAAAAAAGVVPFTPPVPWATGLNCVVGPPATAVTYLGESYYCNVPHVAGATFEEDAGKWTKFAAKGVDGVDGVDGTDAVSNAQGRLTLTSGEPVMSGNVAGAALIYYTPYTGNLVPIYDGVAFVACEFAELSNATVESATGKAGPAAVANNSNYDFFVWKDAGTIRLTRGPAWTSDMARGVGAGTTELERVLGVPLNKQAIANGPAAQRGTYVGTVRSDGAAQINWHTGAHAAGGAAGRLDIWNLYNRVEVGGIIADTTDNWNYTTPTWRAANASSAMRVSVIVGVAEDSVWARCSALASATAGTSVYVGIGYDTSAAPSGLRLSAVAGANAIALWGEHATQPGIGYHYLQAIEYSNPTATTTWYGDAAGALNQTGITYRWRY